MKDFEEISTSILGKTELAEQEKQGTIKLIEPVSKAELTISKQNLSTVTVNENVEIRTILDTSSIKIVYLKSNSKISISRIFYKNRSGRCKITIWRWTKIKRK